MTASTPPLQVLVTRPEPQASLWSDDLHAAGFASHALPLIAIAGPRDVAPVQAMWRAMARQRLLMFVSPAAVEWFFRLRPTDACWADDTLAAAPGPGTARSLLSAGDAFGLRPDMIVSPDAQAEQFDSETLWPLLSPLDWQGRQVSIISGGDENEAKGRTWLAGQWQSRGAQVSSLLTYQRGPGQWTPGQQHVARQALAAPDAHIWLFSSSQAIDHLADHHVPALGLAAPPAWQDARAVVTHPKIAERAGQLGMTRLTFAKPSFAEVAEALRTAR
jgi:uroporphyrinogen-III synthase